MFQINLADSSHIACYMLETPTPSGDYVTLTKAAVTAASSVSAVKLHPE